MTDFRTTDRDVNRAIRSWLREDRHEDVSRIAGVVLGQVALVSRLYKSMGATTIAVPLLALPIVVLLVRLARQPHAIPPGSAAAVESWSERLQS